MTIIDKGFKLFRKITEHVLFPGWRNGRAYITFIKVNQVGNEEMTFDFKVLKGGLTHEHALFELITQRNKGLHAIIKIYGLDRDHVMRALTHMNSFGSTTISLLHFINQLTN